MPWNHQPGTEKTITLHVQIAGSVLLVCSKRCRAARVDLTSCRLESQKTLQLDKEPRSESLLHPSAFGGTGSSLTRLARTRVLVCSPLQPIRKAETWHSSLKQADRNQAWRQTFSLPQCKQFVKRSVADMKPENPRGAWQHAARGAVYCYSYTGQGTGPYLWGDPWSRWCTWWQRCRLVLVWLQVSVLQTEAAFLPICWMYWKCTASTSWLQQTEPTLYPSGGCTENALLAHHDYCKQNQHYTHLVDVLKMHC